MEKEISNLELKKSPDLLEEVIFLVNDLNQIGGVHSFLKTLGESLRDKFSCRLVVIGLKEYPKGSKDQKYIFDKDNHLDLKLAFDINKREVKSILRNTKGLIISCQFMVHLNLQKYLKGKNSVLMFHGDTKDIINKKLYKWHLNYLNKQEIGNYKRLVLLSQGNEELLKKHLKGEVKSVTTHMYNGYSREENLNLFKKSGVFVFVSRLDKDKNIFELLKIFSQKNLHQDLRVHVYGSGNEEDEFIKKIKDLKLEEKVILKGYNPNKEEIFKDKLGLISTSLSEGFPYTFLESINYKVPIYAYNSFTAAGEIVTPDLGSLVETGNVSSFVEILNNTLVDNENKDYKEYEENDFILKIEKYNLDQVRDHWFRLYQEISSSNTYIKVNSWGLKRKVKKIIKIIIGKK